MSRKKLPNISPDLDVSESLAIVASSNILLSSEHGSAIDSFKDVVRFNRASVKGFEKHVGSKTTLRVANNHVFGNVPHTGWETSSQPADFIRNQRNVNILHLGTNAEWENREKHIHQSCKAFLVSYDYIDSMMPSLGSRPSGGFCFLSLCIEAGIKPAIFGYGIDEDGYGHYFDPNSVSSHKFSVEREKIKGWIEAGKVVFYQ
jgi:hypothetical protein